MPKQMIYALSRVGPPLRGVVCLLVVLALGAWMSPARGQDDETSLEAQLDEQRRRLDALEAEIRAARAEARPDEGDDSTVLSPVWERDTLAVPAPLRGVYDKPFLLEAFGRAHVGGYTELEAHSFENGALGIAQGFRMRRTNLFCFAELSDTLRFASEIEFETDFDGSAPSRDIETAVEMAFVDWTIYEEFVFRGGVLLPPLGRVNVNHDGPARELTDRPLVSTFVIPTTLVEAGVGFHGTLAPPGAVALAYEAYLVNGFQLLDANGNLPVPLTERERLLREGRESIGGDNNDQVATTGRCGVTLANRFDAGASWHAGTYDERGDNLLTIVAGDVSFAGSWLDLEGEIASAHFERDDFARGAGMPDDYWGWYAQGTVHGMPAILAAAHPSIFAAPGARLGLVLRYDRVYLDGDRGEALEPGITFRPGSDTVFKLSYRWGFKTVGLDGIPGTEGFHDDGIIFSISTYF